MRAGAELAITFLNSKAEPHVRPLAEAINAPIIMPLDASRPEEQAALFDAIRQKWGRLDILVHSIAFASHDDLCGRVRRYLGGWICQGDGHLGALVHPAGA